jgi:hypothetical protein
LALGPISILKIGKAICSLRKFDRVFKRLSITVVQIVYIDLTVFLRRGPPCPT